MFLDDCVDQDRADQSYQVQDRLNTGIFLQLLLSAKMKGLLCGFSKPF